MNWKFSLYICILSDSVILHRVYYHEDHGMLQHGNALVWRNAATPTLFSMGVRILAWGR